MTKKERTLKDIDAEIDTSVSKLEDLAAKHQSEAEKREKLIDERDVVKVASFDPNLVQLAQDKGINPKNFETEDELKKAIEKGVGNEK